MKIDKTTMSRDDYFPTSIFRFNLAAAEEINPGLIEAIYNEQERDQKGIQRSNFRKLGGWHSQNDLHRQEPYRPLLDGIHGAADLISDEMGYHKGYELRVGTMWSIINPPGSANRAHIHPGCAWSGVYYIQTPENCGQIEFIDPRTENMMFQPRYVPNKQRPKQCWTTVKFTPRAGRMIIFPSWLYHAVAPNLAESGDRDGQRIIISFNLSQQKV